ncbi:MAG: hypothetical protein IKL20_05040 [Alistipes sp.]|nr:hypothetical protein [Alistipes sp.]
MRKLIAIILFLLGVFAYEQIDVVPEQIEVPNEVSDLHREQYTCCRRYNVDAERTTSVVVPTAQTTVVTTPRTHSYRAPHIAASGHFYTTSNYVVAHFIHRLGSLSRAVDFYLYTLCQLRL